MARFLSVDPLTKSYPYYTPYQFAGNKPINSVDLDGLEEKTVIITMGQHPDGTFYQKSAKVTIDPNKKYTDPSGQVYATTHVYYVFEGKTTDGGIIFEKTEAETGLKPSAAYDYTQSEIDGKLTDDIDYIWNGKAGVDDGNLLTRSKAVSDRDDKAPENTAFGEVTEMAGILFIGAFNGKKYNVDEKRYHQGGMKKRILKEAEPKKYNHVVGNNPDVGINQKTGKIELQGTGPYKGKTYPTDLDPEKYLTQ